MEISIPKTKVATSENLVGEFVSRNLNYGKDVSRISVNICRSVQRNILDLPELCRHIRGRRSHFIRGLNLREIFAIAKIKPHMYLTYVQTFYLYCLLNKNEEGTDLLMYSLIDSFLEIIEKDPLIQEFKDPAIINIFLQTY